MNHRPVHSIESVYTRLIFPCINNHKPHVLANIQIFSLLTPFPRTYVLIGYSSYVRKYFAASFPVTFPFWNFNKNLFYDGWPKRLHCMRRSESDGTNNSSHMIKCVFVVTEMFLIRHIRPSNKRNDWQ